jgi:outer membrane protein assembly factor BamB
MRTGIIGATGLILACAGAGCAADWPVYRGPAHDGISRETGWSATFPGDGPRVLWQAEVGTGFSSFVVADGRVITTGHADGADTVFCFDAAKGTLRWKHGYPADLGDKYYEGGTGATPTIAGNNVLHISRWGDVFCLGARNGKVIWSRHVQKEMGYRVPDWGFSGAPFVRGDTVILNAGAAGVAFKLKDGAEVWRSGNDWAAGYSTPFPLGAGEAVSMVLAAEDRFQAVDPANGGILWTQPWKTRYGVNAADPVLGPDGRLFISSGYNRGCALIEPPAGQGSPKAVWENKLLKNQFSSSVLVDGFLFGIDDDESKRASLRCLNWETGKLLWEEKSIGFGSLMAADGKLIILTEKGELVIAQASSGGFEEISRAQVLSGRCWSVPVLSHGRLYVRNSAGLVLCLDMRG